ncbi:MAG: SpoIID/LytB domain-containing protein [Deltaproteobacteria bacterium]
MIDNEPTIRIGICDNVKRVSGRFNAPFMYGDVSIDGEFIAKTENGQASFFYNENHSFICGKEIEFINLNESLFTIDEVVIGIDFHWQRNEPQTFSGSLVLLVSDSGFTVINEIKLEDYIRVVISSEMSEHAPLEFLKAQATVARSWSIATMQREENDECCEKIGDSEIVCWYGRGRHELFDFCADDHCQRYHGITKALSPKAKKAIAETRGLFLVSGGEICDARYHKACGGITDDFHIAWEDREVPYLSAVVDMPYKNNFILTEKQASKWINSTPVAYCNVTDKEVVSTVLPLFDQETNDFFRWKVTYERKELEEIIRRKSQIDFGSLIDIVPLARGRSGRIFRLKIVGTKREMIIGKELEIRRWLSNSHLYSSAFVVEKEKGEEPLADKIILHGAGWGHGVGLCQIGAANMAYSGFSMETILAHYFPHTAILKLY